MDKLLEHIDSLCRDRHWSQYRLAEESGVARSTIATWFDQRKNILPSLESLRRIARAFGISMSTLFTDGETEDGAMIEVTGCQLEILLWLEKYDIHEQNAFRDLLKALKNAE